MKNEGTINVRLTPQAKQYLFDRMAENDCSLSEIIEKLAMESKKQAEQQTVSVQVQIGTATDIYHKLPSECCSISSSKTCLAPCYGSYCSSAPKCKYCFENNRCKQFTLEKNYFSLK